MTRTLVFTHAAFGAFGIVDLGAEAVNMYGSDRAGALAKAAGYASGITEAAHVRALHFGGTADPVRAVVGDQLYYALRT